MSYPFPGLYVPRKLGQWLRIGPEIYVGVAKLDQAAAGLKISAPEVIKVTRGEHLPHGPVAIADVLQQLLDGHTCPTCGQRTLSDGSTAGCPTPPASCFPSSVLS